jgi:hypothetical protein
VRTGNKKQACTTPITGNKDTVTNQSEIDKMFDLMQEQHAALEKRKIVLTPQKEKPMKRLGVQEDHPPSKGSLLFILN